MARILVTGCAGFIGFHVAQALLDRGDEVVGLDNLNTYYDLQLKRDRLALLQSRSGFRFLQCDVVDYPAVEQAVKETETTIHLAAQAGIRYSLENPSVYVQSNLVGFANVLEACRRGGCRHLVYASSSSVYGGNEKTPFSEHDPVDRPVSLYAATKKSNELMAHSYSHLFSLPTTGLRFFTVYGPWGRPDMAAFLFTRSILEGKPLKVYNSGLMHRDFTYIGDVVESVLAVHDRPPHPASAARVLNVGNSQPVLLLDFIHELEACLGMKAVLELLPLQPGDVVSTEADTSMLEELIGAAPSTPLAEGLSQFVAWYRDYYSEEAQA